MGQIEAVIFNLDGVLVTTDACHFQAWRQMAREHGIPFDKAMYETIRGKSRMDGLSLMLEKAQRSFSEGEKLALATRKNDLYMTYIEALGLECMLPGAAETVDALKKRGLKVAVGSSSQNAHFILRQLRLREQFDAVADGNQTMFLKPHPEVFLLAARKMGVQPAGCLVVEDEEDGLIAAHRAGMRALGLGKAAGNPEADFRADSLALVDLPALIARANQQQN